MKTHLKVYLALSVGLDLPDRYRGNNGDACKSVVVQCESLKRLSEILKTSTYLLRQYGVREVGKDEKFYAIAKEPEQIYFHWQHSRSGYFDKWVKYQPRRRKSFVRITERKTLNKK